MPSCAWVVLIVASDDDDSIRSRPGQLCSSGVRGLPYWRASDSCSVRFDFGRMRVAEQPSEALPPHHVTRWAAHCPLPCDQLVVKTLMMALRMVGGQVWGDRRIQRAGMAA